MKSSESSELNRHIGLTALILYGLGDMLGAGIYGLIGKAAGQMGNAIWLAFFASMVAAGLTGLSYASLGSRYPKAGGASYITQRAFGKPWLAYLVGLAVLASGLTSMATAARVFSGYFQAMIGGELPLNLIIIGFSLLLTAIVARGIRESMWVNALCTVIEVSGLLIVIFCGLKFIGQVDYFDASTVSNPSGEIGLSLILTGAVLTFYSFVGFEDILNVAEEVKNPQRTIPIGLLVALLIACLIYMCVSVIAVSVIPAAELTMSNEPLVDVVRKAGPWFPTSLYSVIAMFAVANTALLNLIMGSRLVYGMSNQGLLPHFLSRVHTRRKTPIIATGVLFVIFLSLALSGDISSLAKSTSTLLLLCFMLVNASLVVLKLRKGEKRGSFEIPAFIPVLGAVVCGALLTNVKGPEAITAGTILLVIGVLYLIMRPAAKAISELES